MFAFAYFWGAVFIHERGICMNLYYLNRRTLFLGSIDISILTVLWFLGFVLGAIISSYVPYSFFLGVLPGLLLKPTFFYLCVVNLVPVFLAFVFLLFFPTLCYPLLLLVSFCRSFCGIVAYFLFGESAWLIRMMLLFSSGLISAFIWWLIFKYQKGIMSGLCRIGCLLLLAVCIITAIDCFVISPFLSDLIIYF